MSSLAVVDTDSMLSDFSTSLLNTTADDRAIKKEKGDALKSRDNAARNDSSGNYNLSNVLSNIQDNGPADNEIINEKNESNNEFGVNQIEGNHQDGNQNIDMPEDTFQLSSGGSFIGGDLIL